MDGIMGGIKMMGAVLQFLLDVELSFGSQCYCGNGTGQSFRCCQGDHQCGIKGSHLSRNSIDLRIAISKSS